MQGLRRRFSRWSAAGPGSVARAWLLCGVLVSGPPAFAAEPELTPSSTPAATPAATPGREAEREERLEALMEAMASATGVTARFREVKELALLSSPLESRGRFVFVPPDRLSRTTESPSVSKLVIDGDRVFFRDSADGGSLDLSANPVARQYVRNFMVLFSGDLEELRRQYRLHFELDEGGGEWSLELVPRGAPLARVIERVRLEGVGSALQRMELREVGGDRTTTWFEEVRTDVELGQADLSRIFSGPDPAAGP